MSRVTGLVINEEQKLMAGAHTQRRSVLRALFILGEDFLIFLVYNDARVKRSKPT